MSPRFRRFSLGSPASMIQPMELTHWYANPEARCWRTSRPRSARPFHRTLAGYEPTPLTSLPKLAGELHVGHVFLKDESRRLGLPAFKVLGASWAVCRALCERYDLDESRVSCADLRAHLATAVAAQERPVLVTATDGNHGRALARVARLLGLQSRIYVPVGVTQAAIDAILGEGAELIETGTNYDDAVASAAKSTDEQPNDILVQDTSWRGYTTIPQWIIAGYGTLFDEVDEALSDAGVTGPDLVACPVGVGAFAHAMVDHYRSRAGAPPSLLSVEPEGAACVVQSLLSKQPVSVSTGSTIMTGLDCGTPSELSWPTLAAGLDAAISVSDDECRRAVADLTRLRQDAGPCGAATLAGVRKALAGGDRRKSLDVGEHSVVVLLSTEGLSANPIPVPVLSSTAS